MSNKQEYEQVVTTNATRAIVLLADGISNAVLKQTPHDSINTIAKLGSTSRLELLKFANNSLQNNSNNNCNNNNNTSSGKFNELAQLLGVAVNNCEVKEDFEAQLSGLKVTVASNNAEAVSFLQQQAKHERTLSFSPATMAADLLVSSIILPNLFPTTSSSSSSSASSQQQQQHQCNVFIVHFDANKNDNEQQQQEEQKCIIYLNSVAQVLLSQLSNTVNFEIIIVAKFNNNGTVLEQQTSNKKPTFYPVQSTRYLLGTPVETEDNIRLVASYYHEIMARRDTITQFEEEECMAKAGNGSVLAVRFLAELAYRLGFSAKYGA